MSEQDYLFYTYTGAWNTYTLPFTTNYPHSIILHPQTRRLMHNGVLYSDGLSGGIYFIKGNNSASDTSGNWTGSDIAIDQYFEGLSLIFVPNVAGNNTQTTLNINNLGARNCYFGDVSLTKQYSVGTPILFTYIGTSSSGYWKRADSDTLNTPVELNDTTNTLYLNLTKVTNGLTTIYTCGDDLKFEPGTHKLYSQFFIGNLTGDVTGNVTGNAGSADKLKVGKSLWGQLFDGTTDIKGNIKNTGNITPETTNTSNIGSAAYKYSQVFATYFRGKADGIHVKPISQANANIYILGQKLAQINNANDTGEVYADTNVFISTNDMIHAPYISAGQNTAYDANYCLYVYGPKSARIVKNLICDSNIGIGTTSPSKELTVVGDALFNGTGKGKVTANAFIKSGGTQYDVLIADGTTKKWSDSNTASTIVARNSLGDIYGNLFYTNTTNESISTIDAVFVSNGTDNAIRRISFDNFVTNINTSLENANIIEITKNLNVTVQWMDTGITTESTNFPGGNGTYAIQVDATAINNSTDLYPSIYSGMITIYNGTNNTSETEEIILHRSGYSTAKRLYIRTVPTASSSGYCKIQIASSTAFSQAYDIKFKFKKII